MNRSEIVSWVSSQVLPHEADVRAWLKRAMTVRQDVDDIIYESYCRIAALESIAHIADARGYFFQVVRNVVLEQVRRARIVHIDTVAEIEALNVVDEEASPERIVSGRRELARVQRLIEALPERCRRVFELRKIHDVPQREIARRLGLSENTVEKQTVKGLRLILKALAEDERQTLARRRDRKEQGGKNERRTD